MKQLSAQMLELENFIPQMDKVNESVSKATVAWQIDHSLRVVNSIIKALELSNLKDYKKKFNFWRSVFFTFKYLPRGKGKAPKVVTPEKQITENDLRKKIEYAHENIAKLKGMAKNVYFPHPVFGDCNRSQAELFMQIHTEHHLKIIRDILKS